jgi:sugar phosphate permease
MVILDISIVNVALPSIQEDLHFSPDDLQWVLSAYALTFGGFLLLGGRAADLLGRRAVFMGGVALFTLASLACGLSGSEGMLIAARAVQGRGRPSSPPPRCRSSPRPSTRARRETRRWASGARWAAAAQRSECSSAGS